LVDAVSLFHDFCDADPMIFFWNVQDIKYVISTQIVFTSSNVFLLPPPDLRFNHAS
jgi:hypothetical protein